MDEVLNIMSMVVPRWLLLLLNKNSIYIYNMSEKTADKWTKTPPRQFLILINDLAQTFKSSVFRDQMIVVGGTPCL